MSIKRNIIITILGCVVSFDMYAQTAKRVVNRAQDQDLCLRVNDGGVPTDGFCVTGTTGDITSGTNKTFLLDNKLTLGVDGVRNGIIQTPANLFINIDSDNNAADAQWFTLGKNTSGSEGTELLRVGENGQVRIPGSILIGTGTAPDDSLHIANTNARIIFEDDSETDKKWEIGTGYITGEWSLFDRTNTTTRLSVSGGSGLVTIGHGTVPRLLLQNTASGDVQLDFQRTTAGRDWRLLANSSGGGFNIQYSDDNFSSITATPVVIDGSDVQVILKSVGAGTSVCHSTGGGSLGTLQTCSSSLRYKENVKQISEDRVRDAYKLRGVEYDWKGLNKHDLGLIAEEVEEVFPELIERNGKGETEGVNYRHMVGLLLEVVKSQNERINALESKIQ